MTEKPDGPAHFKGKEAINHVVEAQARGVIASTEAHGIEMPGYLSALCDSTRDTAVALLLIGTLFHFLNIPISTSLLFLALFACGWLLWKAGRAGWLGWQRLERLHRLMSEESYEIQHHRQQERSELTELYRAKGFQGKLLEDVIDVLMADDERLLQVMMEEEMGLQLEVLDHPMQQAVGAAAGVLLSGVICCLGWHLFALPGLTLAALTATGVGASVSAWYDQNRIVPALVWNVALGSLAFGVLYFLIEWVGR
jgi:hypothetical protein